MKGKNVSNDKYVVFACVAYNDEDNNGKTNFVFPILNIIGANEDNVEEIYNKLVEERLKPSFLLVVYDNPYKVVVHNDRCYMSPFKNVYAEVELNPRNGYIRVIRFVPASEILNIIFDGDASVVASVMLIDDNKGVFSLGNYSSDIDEGVKSSNVRAVIEKSLKRNGYAVYKLIGYEPVDDDEDSLPKVIEKV